MPNINFYNVDCIKYINASKRSWDVCFADPPYGIAYQSAWRTDKQDWKPKIKNDEKPFTDWLHPLYSKMNVGGRLICFYRWDVQDEFIGAIEDAGFEIKSQIVWDKVTHGMGDLAGEFAPQHELAFYATKGRYEFAGKRPKTVYRVPRIQGEKLIHPNEKPLPLIKQILSDISCPNESVIDPFAGSFSTAKACLQLGMGCDTTELDDYYFKIGEQYFNKHVNRWHEGLQTPIADQNDYSKLNTGLFALNA